MHGWDILHLHLDLPKEEHLGIIRDRTKAMLRSGWREEVEALLAQGFSGLEKPFQCIGYKEILDLKFGVFKSLAECEERIVISTWQLAKSQRTWFKKDLTKKTFHPLEDENQILKTASDFMK